MNYSLRIQKMQRHLTAGEGLLITGEANRVYFTGFPSSAGALLITKDRAIFLIDFRYFEKARQSVPHCQVLLEIAGNQRLVEQVHGGQITRLYVETKAVSIARLKYLGSLFPTVSISLEDTFDQWIEAERSIKTPEEIAEIQKAQKITDDTFTYILQHLVPGKTEREIMLEMEFYLRKQGSEGVSFDFIVVSGKNSSIPHGVPGDKQIEHGDFVTMDFGAVVGGYHSDMTRTVAIGAVSDLQREVYNTVLQAQKAALEAIKPGKCCRDIDHIARALINQAGFEGCFGHGLGHSVGLEIHEQPCLNLSDEHLLEPGIMMTVEPGIYLENRFGVRIEDMVVVTQDGCADLTQSRKDLIIL